MLKYLLSFICLALHFSLLAQSKSTETAKTTAPKRDYRAVRITAAPRIDGVLDDAVWQQAAITGGFTQESPKQGEPSRRASDVRILYDDQAIYVSAKLHEVSKDSILRELCTRDGDSNADWFMLCLDTYQDGQNGFCFSVNPSGVQSDFKIFSGNLDNSWNAVWQSATHIDDDGWSAEFRIPYSAFRFPNKPEQIWNLQLGREVRFMRETSWWSPFNPTINGFMTQAGTISGINNIKPPLRLSLLPYISSTVEHYPYNEDGKSNYTPNFRAGADIKCGLNDAFTLDMTLVPDFGQARSDNRVLNLSPFEVRYDEQRPFFTEGIELFSKGDLFYSRRIGATPSRFYDVGGDLKNGERIVNNPQQTQLLNSTKISGRTNKGLGVGVLNSVTNTMYAELEDESGGRRRVQTEPFTNYNVLVLDQNLKNNSSVTFVNTNVWRMGDAPEANVSAAIFRINNKQNNYAVWGSARASQQYNTNLNNVVVGRRLGLGFGRTSGKLTWSLTMTDNDKRYDPNDLGYQSNNNTRDMNANIGYYENKPKSGPFINYGGNINASYQRIFEPDRFANFGTYLNGNATTKAFHSIGVFGAFEPIVTYDYFEPRVDGRFYTYPKNYNGGSWFSSDYRKRFALDCSFNYRVFDEPFSRYRFNWSVGPRFRVNNQLSFAYGLDTYSFINDVGYTTRRSDADIILGRRDVRTIENVLSSKYIFNNKMGFTFRMRHYWSTASYKQLFHLDDNGLLADTDFDTEANRAARSTSFNALTIDAVYSWVFAPGSELTLVWKNAIYQSDDVTNIDYITDANKTLAAKQTNNVSLKVLYYIDWQNVKNKFAQKKG